MDGIEEIQEEPNRSFLNWSFKTACPACKGDAEYRVGKRKKLRIKCDRCGHQPFQTDEGQLFLVDRIGAELLGEIQEKSIEPIQEIQEKPEEVIQESIEEIQEKPKGKKRGLYCGLMFITGGLGWIAWRLKRAAQVHS